MSAHVLFVDDDASNLVVFEAMCSDAFPVLTAESAQDALSLMDAHEVGVVLTDQRMPGQTGVELLEQVRRRYPAVVRLLITAYSDLQAAIDAINRGHVRRYLRKPWEPSGLKAELLDALEIYALSQRLESLEGRLLEAERMYALGVIASGIGHEIRNPIGWTLNNLELSQSYVGCLRRQLERGSVDLEAIARQISDLEGALRDSVEGTERVVEIVRGLEMPARSTADDQVDLGEVVRLTLRMLGSRLRNGAVVETDVPGGLMIPGGTTRISQIVLNLTVNAMQAAAQGTASRPWVGIRAGSEGQTVTLEIADNGPGIPPELEERIFDPLFTTKQEGGTGLGLAICKRIATELGGVLEAESPTEGGAVFRLRVPAAS